jgi:hypothetical protein
MSQTDGSPTAADVTSVARRLRDHADTLRARSVTEIRSVLGRVGKRFLDDEDPLRRRALEELPEAAHLSAAMARVVLDGMARSWTEDPLRVLVESEIGVPWCLEGLVGVPWREGHAHRALMAVGPALCVQIVSGGVPGVGVDALVRSLLVKAPTLLKPGRGDTLLPTLFAEALAGEDPELAEGLAVLYWPGGSAELDRAAVAEAELVVVYGSDETVASLRAATPPTARFIGYHHRIGVGVVGRDALMDRESADVDADARDFGWMVTDVMRTAGDVALTVALFERRGCVCPQVVFVEEGGEVSAAGFARALGDAFEALEVDLPAPPATADEAASVTQLRGTAEMHAASGGGEVHHGGSGATWTVIYEPEPVELPDAPGRIVRVRPLDDAEAMGADVRALGPHLQSVGYAGLGDRLSAVTESLGRAGASRVVPFGALSFPPPWWLQDGRGPLRDLLRWVELERE